MASRLRHSFRVLFPCGVVVAAFGCAEGRQGPVRAPSMAKQEVAEAPKTGCRATIECEDEGRCSGAPGACEAEDAADCRGSRGCAKFGSCGYDERLGCVPSEELHCAKSRACELQGLCGFANGQCAAVRDRDCRRAAPCFERGECFAEHFDCVAKTARDCRVSEGCANDGRCLLVEEICASEDTDSRPMICGTRWSGMSPFAPWESPQDDAGYEVGPIVVKKEGRRTELSVELSGASSVPTGFLQWTAPDEVEVTVHGAHLVPSDRQLKGLLVAGAVKKLSLVEWQSEVDPHYDGVTSYVFKVTFNPEGCVDMGAEFVAPSGGKPPRVVLYWDDGNVPTQ